MKVHFKDINNLLETTQTKQSTVEELPLPELVFRQFEKDLAASHDILPEPARSVQDWKVGLLDRFDPVSGENTLNTNSE